MSIKSNDGAIIQEKITTHIINNDEEADFYFDSAIKLSPNTQYNIYVEFDPNNRELTIKY
jgi:hypothetical protein